MASLLNPRAASLFGFVLLLAVVVLGGIAAGLPPKDIGVAAVIAALLFASVFLFAQFRAAKASQGLEQSLRAQAADQAAGMRPDQRASMEDLRKQFEESLALLRQSRMGKGALHKMPWYVLIGPPGSGKTTLLRESGINFPYMRSRTEVRGLGGTRNCDWWFGERAILLDTAGRYFTEFEDRDEWKSFLGLLKKGRRRRPINGAVIGISLADVVSASETELKNHADNVRDRLDELTRSLDLVFPVYLVFTKSDLLGGFVEFFERLNKEERKQVWGFTLPYRWSKDRDFGAEFRKGIDGLYRQLTQARLEAMSTLRERKKKPRIYTFPLQFSLAKERILQFVDLLQQGNPYQESSRIRGCYFTSGTQEGAVVDQLIGRIGEIADVEIEVPPDERKCYFVDNVFEKVVFEDHDLAEATLASSKKERLLRRVGLGAAAVSAAALGAWSVSGYLVDGERNSTVASLARPFAEADPTPDVVETAEVESLWRLMLHVRDDVHEHQDVALRARALLHRRLREGPVRLAAEAVVAAGKSLHVAGQVPERSDAELQQADLAELGRLERELIDLQTAISGHVAAAEARRQELVAVHAHLCDPASGAVGATGSFWLGGLDPKAAGVAKETQNARGLELLAYFDAHRADPQDSALAPRMREHLRLCAKGVEWARPSADELAKEASEKQQRIESLLARLRAERLRRETGRTPEQWFAETEALRKVATSLRLDQLVPSVVGLTAEHDIRSEFQVGVGSVDVTAVLARFRSEKAKVPENLVVRVADAYLTNYLEAAKSAWARLADGSSVAVPADAKAWLTTRRPPVDQLHAVMLESIRPIDDELAGRTGATPPPDPAASPAPARTWESRVRARLAEPFLKLDDLKATEPVETMVAALEDVLGRAREERGASDAGLFFASPTMRDAFDRLEGKVFAAAADAAVRAAKDKLRTRWRGVVEGWDRTVKGVFPFRTERGIQPETELSRADFEKIFQANGASRVLHAIETSALPELALGEAAVSAHQRLDTIAKLFLSRELGAQVELDLRTVATPGHEFRIELANLALSEKTLVGEAQKLKWEGDPKRANLTIRTREQGMGALLQLRDPSVPNVLLDDKDGALKEGVWSFLRLLQFASAAPVTGDRDWLRLTWKFRIAAGTFELSLDAGTRGKPGLERVLGHEPEAFLVTLPKPEELFRGG